MIWVTNCLLNATFVSFSELVLDIEVCLVHVIIGNKIGNLSSNPAQSCLCLILHFYSL